MWTEGDRVVWARSVASSVPSDQEGHPWPTGCGHGGGPLATHSPPRPWLGRDGRRSRSCGTSFRPRRTCGRCSAGDLDERVINSKGEDTVVNSSWPSARGRGVDLVVLNEG